MLCASSCQYRGACTGDKALAVLFSDNDDDENDDQIDDQNDDQETTCASISAVEAWLAGVTSSGGPTRVAAMTQRLVKRPANRRGSVSRSAPQSAAASTTTPSVLDCCG